MVQQIQLIKIDDHVNFTNNDFDWARKTILDFAKRNGEFMLEDMSTLLPTELLISELKSLVWNCKLMSRTSPTCSEEIQYTLYKPNVEDRRGWRYY